MDKNENIKLKCPALDTTFSPEEISAQVLRKLVEDTSKYIGQDINEAVITVPAYLEGFTTSSNAGCWTNCWFKC